MSKTVVSAFGTFTDTEIETLKKGLREISDVMTMMEASKETIKETYSHLFDELKIPKKILRKMAVTYHRSDFDKLSTEHEEFENLYESMIADN